MVDAEHLDRRRRGRTTCAEVENSPRPPMSSTAARANGLARNDDARCDTMVRHGVEAAVAAWRAGPRAPSGTVSVRGSRRGRCGTRGTRDRFEDSARRASRGPSRRSASHGLLSATATWSTSAAAACTPLSRRHAAIARDGYTRRECCGAREARLRRRRDDASVAARAAALESL